MDYSYGELKERYEELKGRYNSMCEASDKNHEEVARLAGENSKLKNDVIRLAEESTASQKNVQLLGDDFNDRSRVMGKHITILRKRLMENGLSGEVD